MADRASFRAEVTVVEVSRRMLKSEARSAQNITHEHQESENLFAKGVLTLVTVKNKTTF